MINWLSIFFNSFWILGLATLLAAFSYHYWQASQNKGQLKLQLSQASFLWPFWLGLILVSIGLAGTSIAIWEKGIWIGFAFLNLINLLKVGKKA